MSNWRDGARGLYLAPEGHTGNPAAAELERPIMPGYSPELIQTMQAAALDESARVSSGVGSSKLRASTWEKISGRDFG
jgi:hypothetical protein